jgi:hypothetical protein
LHRPERVRNNCFLQRQSLHRMRIVNGGRTVRMEIPNCISMFALYRLSGASTTADGLQRTFRKEPVSKGLHFVLADGIRRVDHVKTRIGFECVSESRRIGDPTASISDYAFSAQTVIH